MESKVETPRLRRGGRPKGLPRTGGRKKGTPNHLTSSVKQALFDSFSTLGGKRWLVRLGKEDPRTFAMLLGRIIPTEIGGTLGLTHENALAELERAAKGGG